MPTYSGLSQFDLFDRFLYPFTSGHYSLWVVAVELILIGVPVYLILRFLRGTRGARLFWAVGLILVVSYLLLRVLGEWFSLERINFLYPQMVTAVGLIALVVFQPELRRGLMRIGERGWFRSWSKSTETIIDPIVNAATNLSTAKIGALIAMERQTSLGSVAESGVRLDAEVSAALLESIFWPGSALHDMGVIVRNGRIEAAGCQFPLADAADVDRSLGSRHRAAVGLSQECDAVVIVVSEETGTISVAHKGRLQRSLSPDSLVELLVNAFAAGTAEPADAPKAGKPARKPAPEPPVTSQASVTESSAGHLV